MKNVAVRDLIGIPYATHGRGRGGMDCYGVLIEFYRRAGLDFPDVFYCSTVEEGLASKISDTVKHGFDVERIDYPEYGCVVEISLHGESHAGVYLGGGSFIHATRNMGVCVQDIGRYSKCIKGFWRVIGYGDSQCV